jgi:hypothetical protein
MKELINELVDVLKKRGYNIEIDSASLEFRERGEIFFVCRDLNREDWEKRMCQELLDKIRLY